MESIGVTMFPTILKQLAFKMTFWRQLQHQLGGDVLEGWSRALQKVVCTLNWCPIYDMVSLIARIRRFRIQGAEKEIIPLIITPSDT